MPNLPEYSALPEWVAIVRELVARGVNDVPLLVFTLTYRTFELESGTDVPPWERLLRAFPSVAEAIGQPVKEVQRAVVAVAARVDEEPGLRARTKELAPLLEGLPGVKQVSPPDFGAYPLTVKYRSLALARDIPLPRLADSDAHWLRLLGSLKASAKASDLQLLLACRSSRVTLTTGEVLGPLHPETAYQTLAELLGREAGEVQKSLERQLLSEPDRFFELDSESRALLEELPDVARVECERLKPQPLSTPPYEGPPLDPPWAKAPEPPTSMRWRMGGGEDYMTRWNHFFGGLGTEEKKQYFRRYPPPPEWKRWAARRLRDES